MCATAGLQENGSEFEFAKIWQESATGEAMMFLDNAGTARNRNLADILARSAAMILFCMVDSSFALMTPTLAQ